MITKIIKRLEQLMATKFTGQVVIRLDMRGGGIGQGKIAVEETIG